MKINDVSRTGAINHYRKNNDNKAANVEKKDKVKDEVKISPEAKELLDAQAVANVNNRGQLIQRLKQSVDNGTYHVSTPALVDKLLPYLK